MEDIEMIIKIPEEVRRVLVYDIPLLSPGDRYTVASYTQRAIINGIPIERYEKAVSVQDCINAIENTDCELSPQAWKEITTNILSLPPVAAPRKKGKWIKIGDRDGWSDIIICKCSECEYKTEFTGKFDNHVLVIDPKHAHKYCPSCGTEMENAE